MYLSRKYACKNHNNTTRSNSLPAQPGDIIEFTITASNKGSDPADSLLVTDSLYGGGIYVPGSLEVLTGANTGAKSDAVGDDQLEFDALNNVVKARLGLAANGASGGKLLNTGATDSITSFRFRVQVSADCEIFKCKDSLINMAYATYYGQTSQGVRSLYSTEPGVDANGCPKAGPVAIKIDVNPTCPPYADTAITTCTPYPLNNILPFRPGFNTYFNSSGTAVTEATATGTYYAVRTIYPGFSWLPACKDSIVITFTATGPCTPLPANLIRFEAQGSPQGVIVNWTTAQEINSKHFVVERSTDAVNFEKIATVAAAGNSNTQRYYQYIDMDYPKKSKLYYRLVLVDIDGKTAKSPVRLVLPAGKGERFAIESIAPNPASGKALLTVIAAEKVTVTITVSDYAGRILLVQQPVLNKGQNNIGLALDKLSSGMYMVVIKDTATGTTSTTRLMVQ